MSGDFEEETTSSDCIRITAAFALLPAPELDSELYCGLHTQTWTPHSHSSLVSLKMRAAILGPRTGG